MWLRDMCVCVCVCVCVCRCVCVCVCVEARGVGLWRVPPSPADYIGSLGSVVRSPSRVLQLQKYAEIVLTIFEVSISGEVDPLNTALCVCVCVVALVENTQPILLR